MSFDPFASGAATEAPTSPVQAPAPTGQQNAPASSFDPFASGAADQAKPISDRPEQTDWRGLFSGADKAQNFMSAEQRAKIEAVARDQNDHRNDTVMGLNVAYVKNRLPQLPMDMMLGNWEAVKDAFAKNQLGIDTKNISDEKLYQSIGEQEQAKQVYASQEFKDADTFGKLDMLGRLFAAHSGANVKDQWDAANKPFVKLPDAPQVPNLPSLGMSNPALVAGVWNGSKPLLEGLESRAGVITALAFPVLKGAQATYPMAKVALVGLQGLFTGLMAKSTYDAAKEAPKVFQDPKATLQDKIAVTTNMVVSGGLTLLSGMHMAMDSMPAKGRGKLVSDLSGKTPEEAASVLRQTASQHSDIESVAALHDAADKFETITPKALELGAEKDVPRAGEEKKIASEPAREGPANIQPLDNGGFVVTDRDGKLIDFAASEEEARNLAESSTAPKSQAQVKEMEAIEAEKQSAPKGEEEPNEFEKLTGIKNAAIDAELKEMDLPPATHGEKLTFDEAVKDAAEKLKSDPMAGHSLVSELEREPRPVTGKEDALLLHEVNRLRLERDASEKELIEATNMGDPAAQAEARLRVARAVDDYKRAADVVTKVGTQNAQGLALRRMMLKADYSLAAMEQRRIAANEGKPLTEKQSHEVKDLHEKYQDLQRQFDEYRARQERQGAPSRPRITRGKDRLAELANDARARIKARAMESGGKLFSGGLDPTDLPKHLANVADLAIIGAEHIANGITKFADWSKKMAEEFGETITPHLKEIFEKAHDIGSGENVEKVMEAKKARLESRIKELNTKLETGDLTASAKRASRPETEEIEKLSQQRDSLQSELTSQREAERRVEELEKKIAEKQEKLKDGDLSAQGQKLNRPATEAEEKLKQQRDQLNEQIREARKEANRPDAADVMQKQLEGLNKRIEMKKAQIASGDVSTAQPKSSRPMVKELEEAHQALDQLNEQIRQIRKGPPQDPQISRLEAFKRRTAKTTEEYKKRLEAGDFSKPERPGPIPLDKEALRLKAELEHVKKQIEQGEMRDRLANRSPLEKVRDAFAKWVRIGALSYPTVVAKLAGAAAFRAVGTPAEQLVGYGLSKLLPQLAEAAPREGVPSLPGALKAEAKAISEGLTTGVKGSFDLIRGKDTELTKLLGKNHLPPDWTDYLGKLHEAVKNPIKQAEFARSLELRTQNALRAGMDPHDPIVQIRLMHEAYMDANRSVFMQDNKVVTAYKAALAMLESKDKATGKPSRALQFLSTGIQTELPIVRVPTNVIAEASEILTGALQGPIKAAFAYAKGIENLKPAEADAILRLMKKGLPGLALTALGFLKYKDIGGFFLHGEKPHKDDVKPGEIRTPFADIPSQLLHSPYIMALDFGATMARAADSRMAGEPAGMGHGALAATLGLVEDVPFVRETTQIDKYLDQKNSGDAIAAKAASILVPGGVQWLAAQMDKNSPFSPFEPATSRKAKGIVDSVKKNIPVLREDLPEKKVSHL